MGSGPGERIFAISIGYAVVGFVLALYLNILTVGNARTATRAVRNAVRQQLLVIKVSCLQYFQCIVLSRLVAVWLLGCSIHFYRTRPFPSRLWHRS